MFGTVAKARSTVATQWPQLMPVIASSNVFVMISSKLKAENAYTPAGYHSMISYTLTPYVKTIG